MKGDLTMNQISLPMVAIIEDVDGVQNESFFYSIEEMIENNKPLLSKCVHSPAINHYEIGENGLRRSARLIKSDKDVETWVLGKFPEQKELV